jgi:hypothetical protein
MVCNLANNTATISKLVKGRKVEEPITTFTHPVQESKWVYCNCYELYAHSRPLCTTQGRQDVTPFLCTNYVHVCVFISASGGLCKAPMGRRGGRREILLYCKKSAPICTQGGASRHTIMNILNRFLFYHIFFFHS